MQVGCGTPSVEERLGSGGRGAQLFFEFVQRDPNPALLRKLEELADLLTSTDPERVAIVIGDEAAHARHAVALDEYGPLLVARRPA